MEDDLDEENEDMGEFGEQSAVEVNQPNIADPPENHQVRNLHKPNSCWSISRVFCTMFDLITMDYIMEDIEFTDKHASISGTI